MAAQTKRLSFLCDAREKYKIFSEKALECRIRPRGRYYKALNIFFLIKRSNLYVESAHISSSSKTLSARLLLFR